MNTSQTSNEKNENKNSGQVARYFEELKFKFKDGVPFGDALKGLIRIIVSAVGSPKTALTTEYGMSLKQAVIFLAAYVVVPSCLTVFPLLSWVGGLYASMEMIRGPLVSLIICALVVIVMQWATKEIGKREIKIESIAEFYLLASLPLILIWIPFTLVMVIFGSLTMILAKLPAAFIAVWGVIYSIGLFGSLIAYLIYLIRCFSKRYDLTLAHSIACFAITMVVGWLSAFALNTVTVPLTRPFYGWGAHSYGAASTNEILERQKAVKHELERSIEKIESDKKEETREEIKRETKAEKRASDNQVRSKKEQFRAVQNAPRYRGEDEEYESESYNNYDDDE